MVSSREFYNRRMKMLEEERKKKRAAKREARKAASAAASDSEIEYISYKDSPKGGPSRAVGKDLRRSRRGKIPSSFDVIFDGGAPNHDGYKGFTEAFVMHDYSTYAAQYVSSPTSVGSPMTPDSDRNARNPFGKGSARSPQNGTGSRSPSNKSRRTYEAPRSARNNGQYRESPRRHTREAHGDEDVLSMTTSPRQGGPSRAKGSANSGSRGSSNNGVQSNRQDEAAEEVCCPLLGPLSPFIGQNSLRQLGSSTVVNDAVTLVWRIVLFLVSITCLTFSTFKMINSSNFLFLSASVKAVLTSSTMLGMTLHYRRKREDLEAVYTPRTLYGWSAMMYQANMLTLWYTNLAFMLAPVSPIFAYLTSTSTVRADAAAFLLAILTLAFTADVVLAPISHRITYVPMGTLINIVATTASLAILKISIRFGLVFSVVGAVSVVLGYCLHMYGRVIFFWVHERQLAAEERIRPAFSRRRSPDEEPRCIEDLDV